MKRPGWKVWDHIIQNKTSKNLAPSFFFNHSLTFSTYVYDVCLVKSDKGRELQWQLKFFLRHAENLKHKLKAGETDMSSDPWSRPTMADLRAVLESIGQEEADNNRAVDRLELSVPAEIITSRGNTISAVTREISRFGLGVLHRGAISPGEVIIKMASESREFEYRVEIKWCTPCDNGMFISGGEFLGKNQLDD